VYYNIDVLHNVNHEDFTMMLNRLARETVYFAVNIHKSNHVVVESVILMYTYSHYASQSLKRIA
jgi:hypothetical protein